jgi:hypothetical protein
MGARTDEILRSLINLYSKRAGGASIQQGLAAYWHLAAVDEEKSWKRRNVMTRNWKRSVGGGWFALLLSVGMLQAQSVKPAAPAPVPARILAAKKIFLANAGEDERSTTTPLYSGGPQRAYNDLYAALKAGGRYDLAADPSDADLVFEIGFTMERPVLEGNTFTSSGYDPEFRLTIRDPKTDVLLWTLIAHAQWALLQGNRDRNFDEALTRIAGEAQALGR